MDPLSVALEAIPKALVYATVILSVGVPVARLLFLTRVAGLTRAAGAGPTSSGPASSEREPSSGSAAARTTADERVVLDASLARIALLAASGLVIGLLLRAWGHTAVSFGIADSVAPENLILIAWESQWGQAWQLQMAGAATLAVFAWATTQAPQLAWPTLTFTAAGVCYLVPLLGHAEGEPTRVLVHGTHVLGAGVWVGTLMTIACGVPATMRTPMLRAFAPFAFAGSLTLVASGLVAAWWYLGSPMNLIATTYGWTLGLKLVFVSDVAVFGFLNWRRLHGAAESSGRSQGEVTTRSRGRVSAGSREALVLIEVVMALAVIAVTAVLTESEHPH